jgi:sucrose-phosphate synthase
MAVIPPGTDLRQFFPPKDDESFAFAGQVDRFLQDPEKPLVLALSRPDERKNIPVLLEAFGESEALREAANLLVIAGNREDIRELGSGAREVLTDLLLLIDRLDLYGKVAIPKRHAPEQVPGIYRLASASGGVFVNPALTEPFGLTLLEAAACGLPVVATENGGPVDIIGNCHNGMLVDPLDASAIAEALLGLLGDREAWEKASRNGLEGVRRHYTWKAHASAYLDKLDALLQVEREAPSEWREVEAAPYRDRAVFSDLDQTLLGDPEALKRFAAVLKENRKRVSFGIATGRRIDSALAVMKKYGLPAPDVLISSLGTRIHYGAALSEDQHWADHVDHDWNQSRVRRLLDELPGLKLQPRTMQSSLKVSYYYDPEKAPPAGDIIDMLHQEEVNANVFASFGQFLDIVPARASKGQALRYAALRLGIPLEHILVAGGSGTDEDMIRGNTLAVVVANRHGEELSQVVDSERIYFSEDAHAAGILDAMAHYDFLDRCRVPND